MQAIQTKYISATNSRGSRIKAISASGVSATVSYNYELSGEAVHFEAVKALCKKLGWSGEFISGATKHGYSFLFKNSQSFTI
jgi:hypothetical protein